MGGGGLFYRPPHPGGYHLPLKGTDRVTSLESAKRINIG
jgi:hypothetical protein